MNSQNWKDQMKTALRSTRELNDFFQHEFVETPYPIFLPITLAEKIRERGIDSPLGKQFLPHAEENKTTGLFDPIGDEEKSPLPGLVHRYGNRALFFPTKACPVICRYCFRKNELTENQTLFKAEIESITNYLQEHPEINEIILSGGDPLTVDNKILFDQIAWIAEVSSVKYLRFHTRFPVILPERIDNGFIELLEKIKQRFDVVSLVIHTNHADELDPTVMNKIEMIRKMGVKLLSQTVLLKGVNDTAQSLSKLFLKLAENAVQPYYLHHPDQVKGGMHFSLPLEKGREIYNTLRDQIPGWAIPQYVVDLPNGKGKVPAFNPEKTEFSGRLIDRFGQHQDYSSP